MKELTGAEVIVECLEKLGVEVIFGIPGGVNLPVFDRLYNSKIRVVLTRHEQGAGHMADGYSRATGKAGVCIATSGPGATNLTTPVATAFMDSIPVVALTGQVATHLIGNDAFQEADATGITRPITKHNYLVTRVEELATTIKNSFYIATTGRPGPVHIDIPVDIQRAKTSFEWNSEVKLRSYKPVYKGNIQQIKKAAELINSAKKPLLYIGGGAVLSDSYLLIRELAKKANIPAVLTLMANGVISPDDPMYIGPCGMHGSYAANMAMQKCDVMIALGPRFDDRVTGRLSSFSPNSKKIHVDIDPVNIGKNVPVDVPIVGDLKTVLEDLLPLIKESKHSEWLEEISEWNNKFPLSYNNDSKFVKPQYLIDKVCKYTRGDAIVTTGVGQCQMWAMQWYRCKLPRHFITSGGLGTMGYGYPAAVGAKIACPNKTVICFDGDGSFQMTMSEVATAQMNNAYVITFIINNYYLGMVRQWQELFYGKRFFSALTSPSGKASENTEPVPGKTPYIPDFVKYAEAQGAKGFRVWNNKELDEKIDEIFDASKKSNVIVDVIIDPKEKVFPMVPAGAGLDEIIIDMA